MVEQRVITPEQQNWVSKLLGYDYEIVYKPGKENKVADALSRVQGSPSLNALFMPHASLWDRLKSLASTDPYMIDLDKKATAKPGQPYSWKSGLLFYKNRVVIPPTSDLPIQLLQEFHDSPIGGHSGVLRTFKRIAQQFYWPSMRTQIQNYIAACTVCQKNKAANSSPAGLLQPLPIPHQVWDDIAMDFIDGLPSSGGKDSILVVIDRLSKYAHFLALSHPYSAKVIAEKFVDGIVKYHGMPRSIISDRDPIFMSHFWREFFKLSGTKLNMSSSYHPQTDGQSEVTNRCLEQYLRCFTSQQPRKWSNFLSWAEYCPRGPAPTQKRQAAGMYDLDPFNMINAKFDALTNVLAKKMEDLSMLVSSTSSAGSSQQVAYAEEITSCGIDYGEQAALLLTDDGYAVLEPEEILDAHWTKTGSRFLEEILVRWKNLPHEDATWERSADLQRGFRI
ncbi:hypothetical protein GH714_006085 [Hevea brasiliensis]|uniref:Integrase catalytic domain-containing protein n=1 Tax=Hevea brasiliensis TaxID=3981 RepID=A0A6A6L106_HEVBR|nr:hypothetical protein GH714_006085 [Hevea brasiliensis]